MGEVPDLVTVYEPKERTLKENPLKKYIWDRVRKQNKNYLMAIVGETGSGKSYAGLRLGIELDPTFNIDRIVFSPSEFMALINGGLPSGSVIMYDECGVSMDSRTWYSVMNRMINYVLQTFRHRNLIVLFTVPLMKFMDSNARQLMHAYIVLKEIKRGEKQSYGSMYMLQHNYSLGTTYNKKPRIISGADRVRIDYITFKLPNKTFVAEYERKRGAFTAQLNEGIEKELNMIDAKSKQLTNADILDEVLSQKDKYMMEKSGDWRINPTRIAAKFNIGKSRAAFIREMAEDLLGKDLTKNLQTEAIEPDMEDIDV